MERHPRAVLGLAANSSLTITGAPEDFIAYCPANAAPLRLGAPVFNLDGQRVTAALSELQPIA
ncbi:MAG: hypothetical protein N3A66_00105, partial [Planctomycetota bacterium]|nr:hypothetical protein [Planctomycetota bacterium]